MAQIGEKAGVSKNTVSLALRNDRQIPASTRQQIQRIAEEMGYQKNPVIAHLMAELRSEGATTPSASLALLNANEESRAFNDHPTIPTYIEGCVRRAHQLGYALNSFWLHDSSLSGSRLKRILKARGTRGVIVVGLMQGNRLPERFSEIWHGLPCVVTGVRTRSPSLPFACTDHHQIALTAVEKALQLGYRRPGLVLDESIDSLVDRRFSAGFQTAQTALPFNQRTQPFFRIADVDQNPEVFARWLDKETPDVLLTLYNRVKDWVEDLGYLVPQDIGLIQMEHREREPEWAGMDQHNDKSGEAAVDMVIGMIHNGESGVPPYPRATLIGGTWVDGQTVRTQT